MQAAVDAAILPPTTEVAPRRGEAHWNERGLSFVAFVDHGQFDNEVTWITYVDDPRYGGVQHGGPFSSVGIRRHGSSTLEPTSGAPPWPTEPRAGDDVIEYLRLGLGASRAFVRDRADFVFLLMQERDVVRGDLATWLPQAYPARLLMALRIARDMGDAARADELTTLLRGDLPVASDAGKQEPMRVAAGRWAHRLSRASGKPIEF